MKSITEKVDAIFSKWDKPNSPGCVLGIIQNGELVYTRGYGMANLDYAIPITADSVFRIASVSKQFTAAGILLLAQQGKLSLDDNLRHYVPEIPDYGHSINLNHLLHHTSGLRSNMMLMELAGQSWEGYYDNEDMVALLARQQALNFLPGEEHMYCNSGYVLLAEIIKRVSGQSLNQFTQENICIPLGMNNTQFADDHTRIVKNRVTSYGHNSQGDFRRYMITDDMIGATGLLTTVHDLYRWNQNFYHPKVGGSEFITQMLMPGQLNDGKELHYASGLAHGTYRGLKMVWHGGLTFGFRTQIMRFPQQAFTVICLANMEGFSPARRIQEVADIYLADTFTEPKETFIDLPPQKMSEIAGVYGDEKVGFYVELSIEDDRMMAKVFNGLIPIAPIKYTQSEKGEMIVLQELGGPLAMTFWWQRPLPAHTRFIDMQLSFHKPPRLFHLNIDAFHTAKFTEYVGTYANDELPAVHKVFLRDNTLHIQVGKQPPVPLKFSRDDFFRVDGEMIRFMRNSAGHIINFIRTGPMTRNIRFEREI